MRKALVIGINRYSKPNELRGCVNDAVAMNELLSNNGNQTHNFDVMQLLDEQATYSNINGLLDELYKNDDDISLLYFSGHGNDDNNDGTIISIDMKKIFFRDIMAKISSSKTKYNIVILDCCFSGKLGLDSSIGDKTVLSDNTVILTACRPEETAIDDYVLKHGTFTNLLIGALSGGAADILGRITPGSIYAYIDQALGSWHPRPYFKANVSQFVSIRNVKPKISIERLKVGMNLFTNPYYEYPLDPSYEDTNLRGSKDPKPIKPYAEKDNIIKFKILQTMNQNGLVVPCDEEFMYYAAMKSKKVKLTDLGMHYWRLCKDGRI